MIEPFLFSNIAYSVLVERGIVMKACILEGPKQYAVKDIPVPEPKEGEVLLRVLSSAICVNDVRDYKGENDVSFPRIGGHEFCAVIEKLGPGCHTDLLHEGDHVINFVTDECGICEDCKHGHTNICSESLKGASYHNPDGYSGFFGFSEYMIAKEHHLYVYDADTDNDVAALTEPLACVINSVKRTRIEIGDDVVVIGGGIMGLLHVMVAKKQGARVILSETDEKRRAIGLQMGADVAINPMESDAVQQIKALTNGRGANVVFNTTAIPAVAAQAIEMTAKSGQCNMFSSIHPNEPILVNAGRLHSQEIIVTGTQNGTEESFKQAIDVIRKGILDLHPLISGVYAPEQIEDAIQFASSLDSYKVIIQFSK